MLSHEVQELVKTVVYEGYEEAHSRVPQFTDQLFLWAHENRMQEALSAFLAAFVDKAVVASMELITKRLTEEVSDGGDE